MTLLTHPFRRRRAVLTLSALLGTLTLVDSSQFSAVDGAGNVYVADALNNRIVKFVPAS